MEAIQRRRRRKRRVGASQWHFGLELYSLVHLRAGTMVGVRRCRKGTDWTVWYTPHHSRLSHLARIHGCPDIGEDLKIVSLALVL